MKTSLPCLLLLALLSFAGCPADLEVVPAYVLVEDFSLSTPGDGEPTTEITEVWAFADEEFVGAFRLPARIPVARTGQTTLRFEAGVKQNGILTTPEIYPFYTPVERVVDLAPAQEVALGTLPIAYRPGTRFSVFEDFEPGSVRTFTDVIRGDTTLDATQERVRSGEFSGKIFLSAAEPILELGSANTFVDVRNNGGFVWLEMDFLSDGRGQWGVSAPGTLGSQPIFDPGFNPRNEWTKIYFNLAPIINALNTEPFQLNLLTVLPPDVEQGCVYVDNIKLIHF